MTISSSGLNFEAMDVILDGPRAINLQENDGASDLRNLWPIA
jgi:hypothetical protein